MRAHAADSLRSRRSAIDRLRATAGRSDPAASLEPAPQRRLGTAVTTIRLSPRELLQAGARQKQSCVFSNWTTSAGGTASKTARVTSL